MIENTAEEYVEFRKTRKMNESEITALAREFAGEIHYGDNFFENENKRFLAWLTRRYRLVEKSKVEEEYHEAKFTCGNVDPCLETFATSLAQKSVLERLFPEIAKEVK